MSRVRTVIIDSSYLIYRSYFAYPQLSVGKQPTGALYGFAKMVLRLVRELQPEFLVFTFDSPKQTWRHKELESYKAGRLEPEQEMVSQIPIIQEWCQQITVNSWLAPGWEADDLIYTAVMQLLEHEWEPNRRQLLQQNEVQKRDSLGVGSSQFGYTLWELAKLEKSPKQEMYILSSDQDLYQLLVLPNVKFVKSGKAGKLDFFGGKEFREKFGLEPLQWLDYKALVGDSSDNLAGVEGIGPKTATEVLSYFGSLYCVFKSLGIENRNLLYSSVMSREVECEQVRQDFLENKGKRGRKVLERIREAREIITQTYHLATLKVVPKCFFEPRKWDLSEGLSKLEEYQLRTLVKEIKEVFDQGESMESLF